MPAPPTELAVGLGLRPDTDSARILAALREALGDHRIVCLATIDRRAVEPGLRAAATALNVPLRAYPASDLARVDVQSPSPRTATALGTPSVAEAAALLAGRGPLLFPKRTVGGIVIAATAAG
ncbi:cobalamin biosynthesis protein [Nocardia donostiensis]|uniref:Cobalamin biosynthesis protein n=1 Tax=Nocardia donostiensis TaxID=1538463 RepID=A0A1V2T9I7_9NOCA|nr:cobalamin biosynthesis protein [Nocardia donostiensis]ONM46180.1 cobalamin biosynthesis protein [Nocardia donostiensis]OQS14899.1 cobalamin biosynthesis protein [Nocardia donostiensis]OQS18230.1 cobalamin biosynthesis protein [Nocardia donostiensis]